jgi:membrane fusion protein (multidrug efflux system)
VLLDPAELAEHPLRVGLSTTVEVDTQDLAGKPVSAAVGASIR